MGESSVASTAMDGIISGITTISKAATTNFDIATIASILGIVLTSAAGLFLLWWGARKVVRVVRNAFTKGKLSL